MPLPPALTNEQVGQSYREQEEVALPSQPLTPSASEAIARMAMSLSPFITAQRLHPG